MKKVFQTNVSKERGNCMQAVVASLFELPLDRVPNFLSFGSKWFSKMKGFYRSNGYELTTMFRKKDKEYTLIDIAKFDGGVDGYFYASVPSQTYSDEIHAVVVNTDLEIVHDPNPNQKALLLSPKDVISLDTVGSWYIDTNGNFIRE